MSTENIYLYSVLLGNCCRPRSTAQKLAPLCQTPPADQPCTGPPFLCYNRAIEHPESSIEHRASSIEKGRHDPNATLAAKARRQKAAWTNRSQVVSHIQASFFLGCLKLYSERISPHVVFFAPSVITAAPEFIIYIPFFVEAYISSDRFGWKVSAEKFVSSIPPIKDRQFLPLSLLIRSCDDHAQGGAHRRSISPYTTLGFAGLTPHRPTQTCPQPVRP